MTLEFPSTYIIVYKPLISILWTSFEPFIIWRVWEKPRRERTHWVFVRKEDLASNLKVFPFHPSFSSNKTFLSVKTQTFHSLSLAYLTQSISFPTSKLFIHRTPMRSTHLPWIAFTYFHLKLIKDISFSFETCFLMILHENYILWSHA